MRRCWRGSSCGGGRTIAGYDVIIAGGGISGLAALHFLRRHKPNRTVRLFEADSRLGGTIGTDFQDGYSVDWGPNGFLDREPLTLQLCAELGLTDRLERANENVNKRFILRKGRLRQVPMSPGKFLVSDILSLTGRLRVLAEPFARAAPDNIDESIYDFVCRRIGKQAADYLVQPMVSGIYGGLAERLSLKSCFPVMRAMEAEYGSLFKALIAKKKKARAEGRTAGGPAGPGGWLTSFAGGLYTIIERLAERYEQFITTGKAVNTIVKDAAGYSVKLADGQTEKAETVILALPAYRAAKIVDPLSTRLAESLAAIPYAPISVVCLGYPESAVRRPLDGFGFLVPRREGRRILGSIWTSSIFGARAPEGHVQLRTMVGGDGDHETAKLSETELIDLVKTDLHPILKIDQDPVMTRVYRWNQGIPQFKIGHAQILARLEEELRALGNLHVTGNAYYGIGLNDCIKQSYRVVTGLERG